MTVSDEILERMARAHHERLTRDMEQPMAWDALPSGGNGPRESRLAAMSAALNASGIVEALNEATDHFDQIAAKADHWARTFAANPDGEARWTAIRNHARHRATVLLALTQAPREGGAEQ